MLPCNIDERIRPLVNAFNVCGFRTFASCEGHGFPVHRLPPYVAFYSSIILAAKLERMLRRDAESLTPNLLWGWTLTATFNSSDELGFALRAIKPHCNFHRYFRNTLNADISTLSGMLLLHFKDLTDDWDINYPCVLENSGNN